MGAWWPRVREMETAVQYEMVRRRTSFRNTHEARLMMKLKGAGAEKWRTHDGLAKIGEMKLRTGQFRHRKMNLKDQSLELRRFWITK